jgi:hypothetical protein
MSITVRDLIERLRLLPDLEAEVDMELHGDSDGAPRDREGFYVSDVRSVRCVAGGTVVLSSQMEEEA